MKTLEVKINLVGSGNSDELSQSSPPINWFRCVDRGLQRFFGQPGRSHRRGSATRRQGYYCFCCFICGWGREARVQERYLCPWSQYGRSCRYLLLNSCGIQTKHFRLHYLKHLCFHWRLAFLFLPSLLSVSIFDQQQMAFKRQNSRYWAANAVCPVSERRNSAHLTYAEIVQFGLSVPNEARVRNSRRKAQHLVGTGPSRVLRSNQYFHRRCKILSKQWFSWLMINKIQPIRF